MIVFELPIVYIKNFEEVQKAVDNNYEIDKIEDISETKFIVPEDRMIVFNPCHEDKRCNLTIFEPSEPQSWTIDADYELVDQIITDAREKCQTK